MIAVLLVTALFVVISVYFYFRAEMLQRELLVLKRESANIQKENKNLSKSMALLASSHEDFAKSRLSLLGTNTSENKDIELIIPLINNYAAIFRECLTGKGKMQPMIKKCFDNHDPDAFKAFMKTIIKTDSKLQRLWGSNNLAGFVSLAESLLIKFSKEK
ncbi:MAG: hypothetical protein OQK09_10095 [Colwellia sp.]|nr:hypothetical protein [Colwellia sp.]MCW8864780.1 hypothetical protein [Colwellia sp.]MCW9081849.1 hypothetical protein [Colwellia sp.]